MSTVPKRRTPRWVWTLLVLSLGANLAIAGYAGGQYIRKANQQADGLGRFDRQIIAALPQERREEARAILTRHRDGDDNHLAFATLRQSVSDVSAALLAEPFDKQALADAMRKRREAISGRFAARNARFVELAAMLTLEERKALAGAVSERSERWIRRMERRFGAPANN